MLCVSHRSKIAQMCGSYRLETASASATKDSGREPLCPVIQTPACGNDERRSGRPREQIAIAEVGCRPMTL